LIEWVGWGRPAVLRLVLVAVWPVPGCSGGDSAPTRVADAGPLRSGAVATFFSNPPYHTGGTVTLVFDESASDHFQLEFRDFTFAERGKFDVELFLGNGILPISTALTANLVGHIDEIGATQPPLPPLENRADGTQVIIVPASFGYSVADFNSVVMYCNSMYFTVSLAPFQP
jgi:hypothetical protein